MDDIVVIVGDSFEELQAIVAARQYYILYRRTFDAIAFDGGTMRPDGIAHSGAGAIVIAKRL